MPVINGSQIRKIVVVGDDAGGTVNRAGGTSTTMLAGQLRRQLALQSVTVEQAALSALPPDADVIIAHRGLAERIRAHAPATVLVTVQVFAGDPAVSAVVAAIRNGVNLHG